MSNGSPNAHALNTEKDEQGIKVNRDRYTSLIKVNELMLGIQNYN